MKKIAASAQIVNESGQAVSGSTVVLQTFKLANAKWVKLASAKSSPRGSWRIDQPLELSDRFFAPILRLVEERRPTPRVLTQQCQLKYNAADQTLRADFGSVKRVDISVVVPSTPRLRDSFDAEVLRFRSNEAAMLSKIARKDQLLVANTLELNSVKRRVGELQADLSRVKLDETRLRSENQRFVEEARREAPIGDIATNIGTQVDAANRQLKENQRPYRFGRVQLDLKGTVSSDGQKMSMAKFVDLEKLKSGVTFPGVNLELIPERAPTTASATVKVPDVTGLTETAVRRVLQAFGLRLEKVDKSVASRSKHAIGQSIQQLPGSGSDLPRNQSVLVVFAAETPPTENES